MTKSEQELRDWCLGAQIRTGLICGIEVRPEDAHDLEHYGFAWHGAVVLDIEGAGDGPKVVCDCSSDAIESLMADLARELRATLEDNPAIETWLAQS